MDRKELEQLHRAAVDLFGAESPAAKMFRHEVELLEFDGNAAEALAEWFTDTRRDLPGLR